jgi:NDP-sugar pyrophosphorylase family protein
VTADSAGTSAGAVNANLAGVVLAAGLGTRLRPLTELRPKALCPVGGVPLVDHALRRLADQLVTEGSASGPELLAVNAHHHARQVVEHLANRAHVSVELPQPLGTAGALGHLHAWLDGRDVLLTNADAYLPDGLAELVAGWDRERVRLLVHRPRPGEGGDFDPPEGPVRYVGACLLPWAQVSVLPAAPAGLSEVLWRRERDAGRLDLVTTRGTAIDCGTPADYLAANLHASGGRSVVGEGAVVEGTVERSVVWDGAYVGPDERLVEVVRAGTRDRTITVDCR